MAFQHHHKTHQRTFLKLARDDDTQKQNYCNLYKCSALLKRKRALSEDTAPLRPSLRYCRPQLICFHHQNLPSHGPFLRHLNATTVDCLTSLWKSSFTSYRFLMFSKAFLYSWQLSTSSVHLMKLWDTSRRPLLWMASLHLFRRRLHLIRADFSGFLEPTAR